MSEAKRLEEVIGENIRTLRGDMWSQAEFGEELAPYLGAPWSRSTVSQAEAGKRSFVAAEIVALSKAFGVTIADLYRRQDVGNIIISDTFVISRTEMLAQTMAMDASGLSRLAWQAVDTLDRAQMALRRTAQDLRTVETEQELAIELLSHVGRTKEVDEDNNAPA